MSISRESSAESAPKMSEEPAPVKGPPRNVVTGLVKAIRPRQWVKNLLVLIAPVAAFGSDVRACIGRTDRLRAHQFPVVSSRCANRAQQDDGRECQRHH